VKTAAKKFKFFAAAFPGALDRTGVFVRRADLEVRH
jgi:hypothetical protein